MNGLATTEIDSLTAYGVRGLTCCWMDDLGRWSHKYHLDGRGTPNESVPHSDVYYSLNVLLGLARVSPAVYESSFNVADIFKSLCAAALTLPMRHGAWGMALWAASELGLEAPGAINDKLIALGRNADQAMFWQAQDIGLSLTGICAQAKGDKAWRPVAKTLRDALMTRFRGPGALFRDGARGIRRHVATFATQVYAALALYHYGELMDDQDALGAADACVRTLVSLQGEQGEWPWFYAPAGDRVLDFYEVYSVHQHGMAPALLHHAVRSGVPGARSALVKGFEWVFGQNAMEQSMFVPGLPLIYRSQARCGFAARRDVRLLRAATQMMTGRAARRVPAAKLCLTREMRSYEFGWLLWSFSGRSDYADLINRPAFRPDGA